MSKKVFISDMIFRNKTLPLNLATIITNICFDCCNNCDIKEMFNNIHGKENILKNGYDFYCKNYEE